MPDYLTALCVHSPSWAALHHASPDEQEARGYRHTLAEIGRQPWTWKMTARIVADGSRELSPWLAGGDRCQAAVLTGSGSSHYIGACLAPALQARLGLSVRAVPSGSLLLRPEAFLLRTIETFVVSFGRSGNSPESAAVVDLLRAHHPACRHLLVTCNPQGSLAARARDDGWRPIALVLGERVDDRSLVMTSSFTNMWLAGRLLAVPDAASGDALAGALARAGRRLLEHHIESLAGVARGPLRAVLFLGSGCRFGAALEARLKMLEMSAGRMTASAETYLGLRHGPMVAVDDGTLLVCFLSSDAITRAYELDLIRELRRKRRGGRLMLAGVAVPRDLAAGDDVVVEYAGGEALHDDDLVVLDIMVGQVLGLFRCLHEGLKPDAPSADGVITRVVEPFDLHTQPG